MKELLEKLGNIESECCVTIIMNTHRNKPDIQKDAILLKNLTTEVEQKLRNTFDKRFAQLIIDKIKQLAEGVDHGHNLDSLLLFVSDEISEIVKLPVGVEDRVVIDRKFAIRDLIRGFQLQEWYYILVLSRDKARLIEVLNDQEIREVDYPFPIENTELYLTTKKALSKPKQKDFMTEEFFNRVDKALWPAISENPHQVLICTEERNFFHYMKICDNPDKIIGHLNQNRLDEKAVHIIAEAWPMVLNQLKEKNAQRIAELHQALNIGLFLSDTGEIWRALNEGRGQTLFIKHGYFQPAVISNNMVAVVEDVQESNDTEDMVEDIIEKMVDVNMRNGGDVVFLPEEDLKDFNGLALVTRF
jgi:hypothetical protein